MDDPDYIVVGSGAGGGPLAAKLALRGYKVLLLEAGGDICAMEHGKDLYEVPILHAHASEAEECSWNFYVHHYKDERREKDDYKYVEIKRGVWYPRAGALGGCTAHNALITVTPQAIDWDTIADLTGDSSWRAERMYKYFARLERCGYVSAPGSIRYLARCLWWSITSLLRGRLKYWNNWSSGHGFNGWLSTGRFDLKRVFTDPDLSRTSRVPGFSEIGCMGLAAPRLSGSAAACSSFRAVARERPPYALS